MKIQKCDKQERLILHGEEQKWKNSNTKQQQKKRQKRTEIQNLCSISLHADSEDLIMLT